MENHPVIALVGIFNRQLEPILLRNYLVEYLQNENDQKNKAASQTLAGAEQDLEKV